MFIHFNSYTFKGEESNFKLLLGCVYRPPNTDINLYNCEIIKLFQLIEGERHSMVMIAGDYNLDRFKIETHLPTGEFYNNMLTYVFIPTIRNPTRITDSTSSVIDRDLKAQG